MKHLTPKETYDFLGTEPDAVFIDCRSEWEYLFVGHAKGSLLIPWYEGENWDLNPRLLGEVRAAASHNRPVVLICRSGNRSREAGEFLEKHGFTEVYNVTYGFEGELDDISGLGQTEAAHDLCSGIPAKSRAHRVIEGAGHYGIFSGRRWRETVYPQVRDFIRQFDPRKA